MIRIVRMAPHSTGMTLQHDTPLDVPSLGPFEAEARRLKAMGYRAGVVARKLIDQHGVPKEAAEALTARVFGTTANATSGEQLGLMVTGLVMMVAGLGGLVSLFTVLGLRRSTLVLGAALLLVAGKGLERLVVASMKQD